MLSGTVSPILLPSDKGNMIMQSKLNEGEVRIMLNVDTTEEENIILVPTLRATNAISRQFDGLSNARQKMVAENVDAVSFVIRQGSNMGDKQAKNLQERVWRNGYSGELLVALITYIAILGNGGKPLDEETMKKIQSGDDDGGGDDLGNE